jgi:hypothetical protein
MQIRKNIIFIFTALVIFVLMSNTYKIFSTGAPIASTGAPQEATCGKIGCHADNIINTGNGIIHIQFSNNQFIYEPGKTYTITVSLSQENIERFGFECISLFDSDSSNAGDFILTEANRTQILEGANQFATRKYITYKSAGTSPFSNGLGQWTFNWKAPSTSKGPITFYVASIAANNDGTDNGDLVYTKSLTITPQTLTGINEIGNENAITVFPNPIKEVFTISYPLKKSGTITISLFDLEGKEQIILFKEEQKIGVQKLVINNLDKSLKGIYFLAIKTNEEVVYKKIFIEQ